LTIGGSPNGRNFYETSSADNEVLVATLDGMVSLTLSGLAGAWRESGRMLEGRHARSIAVEPGSGTIFARATDGGVVFSDDEGERWAPIG
jgi:hypothetical protein